MGERTPPLGNTSFKLTLYGCVVSVCATVIVRAGGIIWLNPFATVSFNVCSSVTVECCVVWVCLLFCKEEYFSTVPAINERRDMGMYEVHLDIPCMVFQLMCVLCL